ncbi:hypothetical protein CEXT_565361 [Caerostris extrusa]|uniref:Uncharacterized protein n=1 Tax=Caerostris extrusa TaxID=172846 RepID=A0AAV4UL11_CAEEX|nr:hypothetical protein CEXT_565361 [Caerostris extrusa]
MNDYKNIGTSGYYSRISIGIGKCCFFKNSTKEFIFHSKSATSLRLYPKVEGSSDFIQRELRRGLISGKIASCGIPSSRKVFLKKMVSNEAMREKGVSNL